PASTLKRYAEKNSYMVVNDTRNIEKLGYRVVESDVIISDDVIRHDNLKLAQVILGLLQEV
ncbi:MAG: hypothetical protein WAW67_01035, partial [Candidatus Omnitrophota bacterium]